MRFLASEVPLYLEQRGSGPRGATPHQTGCVQHPTQKIWYKSLNALVQTIAIQCKIMINAHLKEGLLEALPQTQSGVSITPLKNTLVQILTRPRTKHYNPGTHLKHPGTNTYFKHSPKSDEVVRSTHLSPNRVCEIPLTVPLPREEGTTLGTFT